MNISVRHHEHRHGNELFLPHVCRPLGIAALIPGLLLLLLAGFVAWKEYRKDATWVKTHAMVTELVASENRDAYTPSNRMPEGRRLSDMGSVGDGTYVSVRQKEKPSYLYTPRFTFTAQDGQEYSVCRGLASNPPAYRVGQTIRIHYPPQHPKSASPCTFWQQYFPAVILGALGCALTGMGLILLLISRAPEPPRLNIEPGEVDLPDGVHLS